MLKIKNKLITALVTAWSLTISPSIAEITIGEGYAKASFREIYQTMVIMGGIDIDKPEILTEYIKLIYCELYKKYYTDDIKWNNITKEVHSNIVDRKENYRIMYEFTEVINLGRYNFEEEIFELKKKSKMKNVGSVLLLTDRDFKPYCPIEDEDYLFPSNVALVLTEPLNMTRLKVPRNNLKQLLSSLESEENAAKAVYARIRFKVIDAPGLFFRKRDKEVAIRAEVRGSIESIDFFYDKELTKHIDFIKIDKSQ